MDETAHPPSDPGAGRLSDVQIPELLWRLHEARRTGCLKVQSGDVTKQLWLIAGQPAGIQSLKLSPMVILSRHLRSSG